MVRRSGTEPALSDVRSPPWYLKARLASSFYWLLECASLKDLPHLTLTPAAFFNQPETSSDFFVCQSMLTDPEGRCEPPFLFSLFRCFLSKEPSKEVVIA